MGEVDKDRDGLQGRREVLGTEGMEDGVSGAGKGVERTFALGKKTATTNKQQSSVLSRCLSSTSCPLCASSDL